MLLQRIAQHGITRRDLAELSLQCTNGEIRTAASDELVYLMEALSHLVVFAASKNLFEAATAQYGDAPSKAGAALNDVSAIWERGGGNPNQKFTLARLSSTWKYLICFIFYFS